VDIQLIQIDELTKKISLGMSPRPVKGLTKLVQLVVLSLLNVPGNDILDPDRGAGIPEMLGMNFDPSDLSEILSEGSRRVKVTQAEVLSDQIGIEVPLSERLKELKIISVSPGESLDEVSIRIRVINELGQQSDMVL